MSEIGMQYGTCKSIETINFSGTQRGLWRKQSLGVSQTMTWSAERCSSNICSSTPTTPVSSPGVRVAEMHSVQHVVVRGSARHLGPRHPGTLHRTLLHEEESPPCKAPHNACWISEQVTNLSQCQTAHTLIKCFTIVPFSETLGVSTVAARPTWRWVPY